RRRHTRCLSDWSSDVCSSDLSLSSFLPSIFFSGYIFPRETMPKFFYVLTYFVPATYFIDITRGIILRGAGWVHLWIDAVALFFKIGRASCRERAQLWVCGVVV